MVRLFFSLITVMLLTSASCKKELHKLSMAKTPYTGNELKMDGYYYSNPYPGNVIGIAVLYRNGVCVHMRTEIKSQDTTGFIKNEILLNNGLMSRLWSTPTDIGVFQINNRSVKLESWVAGRDITTFSHFGEIVNDTTFLITNWNNNDTGKSYQVNQVYRFKQFSQKPDSTNNFIK